MCRIFSSSPRTGPIAYPTNIAHAIDGMISILIFVQGLFQNLSHHYYPNHWWNDVYLCKWTMPQFIDEYSICHWWYALYFRVWPADFFATFSGSLLQDRPRVPYGLQHGRRNDTYSEFPIKRFIALCISFVCACLFIVLNFSPPFTCNKSKRKRKKQKDMQLCVNLSQAPAHTIDRLRP